MTNIRRATVGRSPALLPTTLVILGALCLATLALAPRAEAFVFWTNGDAIGRANLDSTKVDQNFIPGAGRYPGGVAVDDAHVYWGNAEITNSPLLNGGSIGRANLDGTGVEQQFTSSYRCWCPGGAAFLSEDDSPRRPANSGGR